MQRITLTITLTADVQSAGDMMLAQQWHATDFGPTTLIEKFEDMVTESGAVLLETEDGEQAIEAEINERLHDVQDIGDR